MTDDRQDRIRQRAHAIWENRGRPHGHDREHWDLATREVDAEDAAAKTAKTKKPARVAATSKPKATAKTSTAKASAAKKPVAKAKAKPAK
jgi:hypothetical protein